MSYVVEMKNVAAAPLFVVRRRASQDQLKIVVPEACGAVWASIKRLNITSAGRLVAVYLNCVYDLEIGVEIAADAVPGDSLIASSTPAGRVATTTHIGPYDQLGKAHQAIHAWCASHHQAAGISWEIYGHWTDDTSKLQTDIYYLLKDDETSAG